MLLASYRICGPWDIMDTRLIAGACILCLISAVLTVFQFNPGRQFLSSVFIGILIFSAGLLRIHQFKNEIYVETLTQSEYRQGVFSVTHVMKNKGFSISLRCKPITLYDKDGKLVVPDKFVLLYIRSPEQLNFFPGDFIRAEGWYSAIPGPLNPNAFDARVYYNTLGIRYQMYCKGSNVSIVAPAKNSITRVTARWQASLSGLVKKHISPQVAQLTNALVWGDRSDMDSEVRDAFADSGAMHVLSVSGMHVAIIYSMLFFILGSPSSGPFIHRVVRFTCYSSAIVLYMGLTGACPAVVRAGLMILLYLFGKSMGWNTQVWNLLGFAAFVMMWINPYVWQNLGFQLSFLAMAGILLFAKPVIRSVSFKNIILYRAWEITALSIAAQIFILPILLRQFHQFPLTFIFSSIAAIPAAYLVMLLAIVNIIFSFVGIDFLWHALDWVGKIFIEVMQWMSGLNPLMHFSLPAAGGIFLLMMAVVFSIALVFSWPTGKRIAWIFGFLTFITLGCHRADQWTKGELIIYHSTKGLIIDITDRGYCYSILDCSIPPASIEFTTRGYRCERDIINLRNICKGENFRQDDFDYSNSTLQVPPYSFQVWNDTARISYPPPTYIIIDECLDVNILEENIEEFIGSNIILPAHLDKYTREDIVELFESRQLTYYDIDEKGYFGLQL